MPITAKEAAARLDGGQYRREGSPEIWAEMKEAGLVAVFGASDDLMEFRGAIYDEEDCYEGGLVFVDQHGLVTNRCPQGADCPNYVQKGRQLEALWCAAGAPPWSYSTTIPHENFTIYEEEDAFCQGIVFALTDCR